VDLEAAVLLKRSRFFAPFLIIDGPVTAPPHCERRGQIVRTQKCHLPGLDYEGKTLQSLFRLWLYDELALHSAVADPATIAAVEGVSPRRARHEFHNGQDSLFELEAVIIRAKDESRLALLFRSVRTEIDLEAVRLIERCDS
jgi:hypothetical protein